jgi:hypothetical protein
MMTVMVVGLGLGSERARAGGFQRGALGDASWEWIRGRMHSTRNSD